MNKKSVSLNWNLMYVLNVLGSYISLNLIFSINSLSFVILLVLFMVFPIFDTKVPTWVSDM